MTDQLVQLSDIESDKSFALLECLQLEASLIPDTTEKLLRPPQIVIAKTQRVEQRRIRIKPNGAGNATSDFSKLGMIAALVRGTEKNNCFRCIEYLQRVRVSSVVGVYQRFLENNASKGMCNENDRSVTLPLASQLVQKVLSMGENAVLVCGVCVSLSDPCLISIDHNPRLWTLFGQEVGRPEDFGPA